MEGIRTLQRRHIMKGIFANGIASAFVLAFTLPTPSAFSAGFENDTLWSGKYAGMANAVVGTVSDSQAIYFNPAGLAGVTGSELSANYTAMWLTFHGPVLGTEQNSNTTLASLFGITASYGITPKWGIG